MQKLPASHNRSYSRVLRRDGKSVRRTEPAGPKADFLREAAELVRLDREANNLALGHLRSSLEPARAATRAYREAVHDLFVRFMKFHGYHAVRQVWKRKQMSAELYARLEGRMPHSARDLDRATDLGRAAHDAWFALLSGGDAGTEAAARNELAAKRATWAEPGDPPALALQVDGLALAWMQSRYFELQYSRALAAKLPDDQVAVYVSRAGAARRAMAELQAELAAARRAQVEYRIRRVKLERLQQRARERVKKNAAAQSARTKTSLPRR